VGEGAILTLTIGRPIIGEIYPAVKIKLTTGGTLVIDIDKKNFKRMLVISLFLRILSANSAFSVVSFFLTGRDLVYTMNV